MAIATSPPRGPLPWLAIRVGGGRLLSLVPLAVGLWQLAALHRRSRVIDDLRWLALLDELRRQLAVRRSVQLRQSEAALAAAHLGRSTRRAAGARRGREWPEQRRRLVLLHELAHVRRWDWLTQLVAHVACAVYWFNPLVWLAARQMRIERERACDDLVLACGAKASDYAQELLALAAGLSELRSCRRWWPCRWLAGAARRSPPRHSRCRRSRAALTTAAVCLAALAAAAIAPLAMLRAAPPEEPDKLPAEDPKPADQTHRQSRRSRRCTAGSAVADARGN